MTNKSSLFISCFTAACGLSSSIFAMGSDWERRDRLNYTSYKIDQGSCILTDKMPQDEVLETNLRAERRQGQGVQYSYSLIYATQDNHVIVVVNRKTGEMHKEYFQGEKKIAKETFNLEFREPIASLLKRINDRIIELELIECGEDK